MKEFTSLAQKSRHYLKQVLPSVPVRRHYKAVKDVKSLPVELQELDSALTFFKFSDPEMYCIVYDTYVNSLTTTQMSVKYSYSKRSIERLRFQALESFYKHLPERFK